MAKNWHVEREFECLGLKCVVAFMKLGHRCGYVGVPVGHKLYGVDYNEVDFMPRRFDLFGRWCKFGISY